MAYFVPPSAHFAGIERVVHEIAAGLVANHGDQLEIHVLFCSPYDEELLRQVDYQLHVLGVDRLRNLVAALRSVVRENRFDVLICPQVEASVISWLATRGLGLPVFITHLHGNPRLEEAEGTRRTRLAFTLFRHVVSRRIAGILAVSQSLQHYATESVTKGAKVYFVKNPVRDLGAAVRPPTSDGPFRFLNVARLSRQKGQEVLLEALAIARPRLPKVTLTLVGNGPDETNLRQLSSRLGVDDIVIFAGYAPDPASRFSEADCFVLASRWEGFGVVLVEALQFGLPLLATNCEFGPSDIITDPRIGELVDPASPDALSKGLERAAARLRNPQDEAFRRASAEAFSPHQATEMHFGVLQDIVASRATRLGHLRVSNARR